MSQSSRWVRPEAIPVVGIGGWVVHGPDGRPSKLSKAGRDTLATLVAKGPTGLRGELLAELLFPEQSLGESGAKVRVRISRLRIALPPGAIPDGGNDGHYQLALDADEVDIWRLLELARDGQRTITADDLLWALDGEPFAGVDLPADAAQAFYDATRAQRVVAERYCLSAPASIPFQVSERLLWMAARDPYDEKLAVLVADTLAKADLKKDAITALEKFVETFESDLGYRPAEATAMLERLHRPSTGGPPLGHLPPAPGGFPAELARLRQRTCVGRDDEIARLVGRTGGLVIGAGGSGKSQLLVEIAERELARGNDVTYLAAQEDADVELAPFLAALPGLGPAIDRINQARREGDGLGADNERALTSQLWTSTLEVLAPSTEQGHRHLLVDDGQWLDQRSAAMVELLARSAPSRPLTVTVSGRNDDQEPEWLRLQEQLMGLSFERCELGGLAPASLETLIAEAHPLTTEQARRELAIEVLALSGGLPRAARAIIDAIEAPSLTIPDRIGLGGGLGWSVARLDETVRTVGLASAVLGLRFSLTDLLAICDLEPECVHRSLDVLVAEGHLVTDASGHEGPERFSFEHVLTQQAFLQPAPPFQLRRLYLAAADLTRDVHARARYLARAGRPHDRAAGALRASAAAHVERQQWWMVAKQLRRAEQLDPDQLTAADYTNFAIGLDLSGQDGTAPRQRAFALAVEAQDWSGALAAALSGLPSAERPDGDPSRLALLEQLVDCPLESDLRFSHARHLARHLALSGNPKKGRAQAELALELATNDDERAEAHLALWTATHHIVPEPHRFPADLVAEASGPIRARVAQMQAITALEDGDVDAANRHHRAFRETAIELDDPLRIWHAMTFDAVTAFDQGRWQVSDRLSERAYRFGLLHGHQEATSVRAGQLFMVHFAAGRVGELLPFFETVPSNIRRSALASASYALAEAAAGDQEKAASLAVELVEDALARPRSSSLTVLGLLSPVVATSGNRDLIVRSRDWLLPFAERSVVVGFGIANMGPLWGYVSPLADDERQERRWLLRAVEASKQLGSPSWTAVNLYRLADLTGDDAHRAEARSLCQDTDILRWPR